MAACYLMLGAGLRKRTNDRGQRDCGSLPDDAVAPLAQSGRIRVYFGDECAFVLERQSGGRINLRRRSDYENNVRLRGRLFGARPDVARQLFAEPHNLRTEPSSTRMVDLRFVESV